MTELEKAAIDYWRNRMIPMSTEHFIAGALWMLEQARLIAHPAAAEEGYQDVELSALQSLTEELPELEK